MEEKERLRRLFDSLRDLTTERRNPGTMGIDMAGVEEILRMMNEEDKTVAEAVEKAIPSVARAVEHVVESFKNGGRLFYFGAGTSGRLGVLDAAECPPTFGVDPALVRGVIAGGRDTVFLSREGVEDDEGAGEKDVEENGVEARDTVVGITASRRTPYVVGALRAARRIGASTVFLTCNEPVSIDVDVQINVVVGPEAIAGSTRLKAGTAQKMILNMISTAAMVRMGKVYENLMVDLEPASEKLCERAKGMIMMLVDCSYEEAAGLFEKAGRNVKVAVVMGKLGVSRDEAVAKLENADGFLARALEER